MRLNFDGGSRGNPGLGGIAAVVVHQGMVLSKATTLPHVTNNEAEYEALLLGLDFALKLNRTYSVVSSSSYYSDHLDIKGDSKLVVCQVTGEWQCRDVKLQQLLVKTLCKLKRFPSWEISHVLRGRNKAADALANCAMDSVNL